MTTPNLRIREASGRTPDGTLSLPSEYVDRSFQRLGMLAAIYAATYFLAAYIIPHPRDPIVGSILQPRTLDVIGIAFIAGALLLVAVIKSGRIRKEFVALHGIAFQIYGAIGIEIGILTWNGDPSALPNGPTWVSVWILSFPLFLPTRPKTTLIAGVATASVLPSMVLLARILGVVVPDLVTMLPTLVPAYISAGIATFAASVIHKLGQDVASAKKMGSYRLIEKLGVGGMGEVWLAEHRMLARPAAIKLINTDGMLDAQREIQLERFEREVQSTARLKSPHTIDVYDYGTTTDGTFYYVMELLEGLSLDQVVQKHGQQHPARVIHVLRQMCHSLGEAHEKGIIHRDLKPANIFLCREGRDVDVVKILDFGLVKIERPDHVKNAELTQAGHFIGTPTYAAPEMANGEIDRIDQRTDIYQIGCVAFWLLTGRTVFEEENVVKMLVAHANKYPDPPSLHCHFDVPEGLDGIIMKCLSKEMEDRFANVDELNEALGAIEASCAWCPKKAGKWWSECGVERRASSTGLSTEERGAATVIQPVA